MPRGQDHLYEWVCSSVFPPSNLAHKLTAHRACTCIHHEGCRADTDCSRYHVHCPTGQSIMCQQMDPFWRNNVCICVTKPEGPGECNCDHTACDWGRTGCGDDGFVFLSFSFPPTSSQFILTKPGVEKRMSLPRRHWLRSISSKRQANELQPSVDALPVCHDAVLLDGRCEVQGRPVYWPADFV